MKYTLVMPSLLLLAACANNPSGVTPTQMATPNPVTMALTGGAESPKNMERMATNVKDGIYTTADRFKKWALTPPPEEGPKKAVPASYCYQSFQDVLCYRQPMPGWEARLVGYQGTDVEPPSPVTMKPLPVRAANTAMLPANRAANAKPLVVGAAITPKADGEPKNTEMKEIAVDAAHESLPDPALAPQL